MKQLSKVFYFLFLINITFAQKDLTVEEIYNRRDLYGQNLYQVEWFDGGNKFSHIKLDPITRTVALYQYDVATGNESILVRGEDLKISKTDENFSINNYEWSPDRKYILFTGVLPARRVKSGGTFYIYEVATKKFFVLAESEEEQVNATFSPDGTQLAFVRGNNLFVVDIKSGKEKQLTFDGNENILNGLFDWVYEEEFSIIVGYKWSPDSKKIAYWRLDQSNVPQIKIAKWDSLYFNFIDMHYPKPGSPNSKVQIGVVNVNDGKNTWMDIGKEEDIYIPRIKFTNNPDVLSIQRLNRLQNRLEVLFCNIKDGKSKIVLTEEDNAWIDINDDLHFLNTKEQFIWTSEKDGFMHIYLYDNNGKLVNQITSGKWEVSGVLGLDEKEENVFYTSNERNINYKDFYSANLLNGKRKLLTEKPGTHSINLSFNGKYFIDRFGSSREISSTSLFKTDGALIKDLLVSSNRIFEEFNLSFPEFFTIKTSDGAELNASILKPVDFDSTKRYPVLFEVYGGPGSQNVKDSWDGAEFLWHHMLTQKGYIILKVDNRGTGGKGAAFKKIVYKDLGNFEVRDMIEAARYLGTLSYVDTDRIGIWGWSYGGYTTSITMTNASEYFKMGIAVAPVSDWRYYDNIYTERFMSTPQLNPDGYEKSSVINNVAKLKGKLLVVHGTADDNVHFQNSVKLIDKAIELNKPIDAMYYPEKDHSIYGGMTRIHLFNKLTEYILNNL